LQHKKAPHMRGFSFS